jgi:hypothetical protein
MIEQIQASAEKRVLLIYIFDALAAVFFFKFSFYSDLKEVRSLDKIHSKWHF